MSLLQTVCILLLIKTDDLEKRLRLDAEKEVSYEEKRNQIFLGTPAKKAAYECSKNYDTAFPPKKESRLTSNLCSTSRLFPIRDDGQQEIPLAKTPEVRSIKDYTSSALTVVRNPNSIIGNAISRMC